MVSKMFLECKNGLLSNVAIKPLTRNFRKSLPLLVLFLWLVYCYSEIRQNESNKDPMLIDHPVLTFQDKIVLKDKDGHVILEKRIDKLWQQPLHKWNYRKEVLFFMHIVKSSGTSLGHSLRQSYHNDGCHVSCTHSFKQLANQTCASDLKVHCGGHFDWGQVDKLEEAELKTAPITLIRNPVDRAVSHFYYVHQKPWYKHMKMYHQNFSDYIRNPESMMQSRHVWFDGQVSESLNYILKYTEFHVEIYIGRSKGGGLRDPSPLLGRNIFSCSFWGELDKIIGCQPAPLWLTPPPVRNPASATNQY